MNDEILSNYNPWEFHGEKFSIEECTHESDEDNNDAIGSVDLIEPLVQNDVDETFAMVHDMRNTRAFNIKGEFERLDGPSISDSPELLEKFGRLVRDTEKELFPGCEKFDKVEVMVHLLCVKCLCSWSDKSLIVIIESLKKAFVFYDTFPRNAYEATKYTRELGLSYLMTGAYKNHCILYCKEHENAKKCPKYVHPK